MADIDRELVKQNGWRFGVCFSEASAPDLFAAIRDDHRDSSVVYLVATHDCSLIDPRLDEEPYVEYLVARPVTDKNGNFTFAKNPRRLHLDIHLDGAPQFYSLRISDRGFLDRALLERSRPDARLAIDKDNKRVFSRWLANRYTTRGFPDEFNKRISGVVEGKKACLKKLFDKAESKQMLGVYIGLEPFDQDLPAEKSYSAIFTLLYEHTAIDAEDKRDRLENYASEIKKCLLNAKGVVVQDVLPLSEKDINLYSYRKLQQWQWDYISLRAPEGDAELIEEDPP